MSKHTHGPWEWTREGVRYQRLLARRGPEILSGQGYGQAMGVDNLIIGVADARLIAAAPDLLVACKVARNLFASYEPTAIPEWAIEQVDEQLLSAVAKAEGGSDER